MHEFHELYESWQYSERNDNPYCLTSISGIGFRRADEIARAAGFTADDLPHMLEAEQEVADRLRELIEYKPIEH